MVEVSSRLAGIVAFAAAAMLAACSPAVEPAAPVVAAPATPLYISTKQVSTDCGVDALPSSPPGFAERIGGIVADMPPPIAARQAIGADRPFELALAARDG